jgi:hypothetical protein
LVAALCASTTSSPSLLAAAAGQRSGARVELHSELEQLELEHIDVDVFVLVGTAVARSAAVARVLLACQRSRLGFERANHELEHLLARVGVNHSRFEFGKVRQLTLHQLFVGHLAIETRRRLEQSTGQRRVKRTLRVVRTSHFGAAEQSITTTADFVLGIGHTECNVAQHACKADHCEKRWRGAEALACPPQMCAQLLNRKLVQMRQHCNLADTRRVTHGGSEASALFHGQVGVRIRVTTDHSARRAQHCVRAQHGTGASGAGGGTRLESAVEFGTAGVDRDKQNIALVGAASRLAIDRVERRRHNRRERAVARSQRCGGRAGDNRRRRGRARRRGEANRRQIGHTDGGRTIARLSGGAIVGTDRAVNGDGSRSSIGAGERAFAHCAHRGIVSGDHFRCNGIGNSGEKRLELLERGGDRDELGQRGSGADKAVDDLQAHSDFPQRKQNSFLKRTQFLQRRRVHCACLRCWQKDGLVVECFAVVWIFLNHLFFEK